MYAIAVMRYVVISTPDVCILICSVHCILGKTILQGDGYDSWNFYHSGRNDAFSAWLTCTVVVGRALRRMPVQNGLKLYNAVKMVIFVCQKQKLPIKMMEPT